MHKVLVNFIVAFLAVVAGLFIHDLIRGQPVVADARAVDLLVLTGDTHYPAMGVGRHCNSPNLDDFAAVLLNCTYGAGQ